MHETVKALEHENRQLRKKMSEYAKQVDIVLNALAAEQSANTTLTALTKSQAIQLATANAQIASLKDQVAANPQPDSDDQAADARLATVAAAILAQQNQSGGTTTAPAPNLSSGTTTSPAPNGSTGTITTTTGPLNNGSGSAVSPPSTTTVAPALTPSVTGGIVTDAKGVTLYTVKPGTTIDPAVWTLAGQYESQNVYYYAGDKVAGDTLGDGLGNVWAKIPAPPNA